MALGKLSLCMYLRTETGERKTLTTGMANEAQLHPPFRDFRWRKIPLGRYIRPIGATAGGWIGAAPTGCLCDGGHLTPALAFLRNDHPPAGVAIPPSAYNPTNGPRCCCCCCCGKYAAGVVPCAFLTKSPTDSNGSSGTNSSSPRLAAQCEARPERCDADRFAACRRHSSERAPNNCHFAAHSLIPSSATAAATSTIENRTFHSAHTHTHNSSTQGGWSGEEKELETSKPTTNARPTHHQRCCGTVLRVGSIFITLLPFRTHARSR